MVNALASITETSKSYPLTLTSLVGTEKYNRDAAWRLQLPPEHQVLGPPIESSPRDISDFAGGAIVHMCRWDYGARFRIGREIENLTKHLPLTRVDDLRIKNALSEAEERVFGVVALIEKSYVNFLLYNKMGDYSKDQESVRYLVLISLEYVCVVFEDELKRLDISRILREHGETYTSSIVEIIRKRLGEQLSDQMYGQLGLIHNFATEGRDLARPFPRR